MGGLGCTFMFNHFLDDWGFAKEMCVDMCVRKVLKIQIFWPNIIFRTYD